jgi:hypothetical protein
MRASVLLNQRTILPMKRVSYVLIFLVLSTQVDDTWTVASISPFAPLVDDNDEYVPSQQRPHEVECSPHQKPLCVGLKPQAADFPFVRRGLPSDWSLTKPFAPPPLYVFMSLQI